MAEANRVEQAKRIAEEAKRVEQATRAEQANKLEALELSKKQECIERAKSFRQSVVAKAATRRDQTTKRKAREVDKSIQLRRNCTNRMFPSVAAPCACLCHHCTTNCIVLCTLAAW